MEERRRKFPMYISLGHILTMFTIALAGIGIWTQLYADVEKTKTEIANIKVNEIKKEQADKEYREQIKSDVRDVKTEVREVNRKLDQLIQNVLKR